MTTKLTPKQKKAIRDERNEQRKQRAALVLKIENCHDDHELQALGSQLNELVNVKRSETEYIADHGPKEKPKAVLTKPTPKPKPVPEVVKFMEPKGEPIVTKLTIEKYNDYRAQGLKDKDIAKRESMNIQALNKFKNANGLTKKHKQHTAEVAPKEPKWDKVQQSIENYNANKSEKSDEIRASVQPIKKERILAAIAHPNQFDSHIENLIAIGNEDNQKRIESLEATIQHNLKHIAGLQSQLDKLKVIERDYIKLEVDYRNEKFENNRLLDMLEKMKNTKLLNYLLMKDSVGMIEQLDQMAERTEIGEVDNTWR